MRLSVRVMGCCGQCGARLPTSSSAAYDICTPPSPKHLGSQSRAKRGAQGGMPLARMLEKPAPARPRARRRRQREEGKHLEKMPRQPAGLLSIQWGGGTLTRGRAVVVAHERSTAPWGWGGGHRAPLIEACQGTPAHSRPRRSSSHERSATRNSSMCLRSAAGFAVCPCVCVVCVCVRGGGLGG